MKDASDVANIVAVVKPKTKMVSKRFGGARTNSEIFVTEKKKFSPWLVLTGLLGILAAYSHFFGLSYRKSYLATIGFEHVPVSLGADESLYYAVEGTTGGLLRLLKVFSIDILTMEMAIISGVTISAGILLARANSIVPINFNRLKVLIKSAPHSNTSAIFGAILGFFLGWLVFIVLALYWVLGLALIWMFMSMGMSAGNAAGQKLISQPVCQSTEIDERSLGCRVLLTSDGNKLVGLRVHSYNDVQYILTNSGAYDVTDKGVVLSYRPIYEPDKDDTKSMGE